MLLKAMIMTIAAIGVLSGTAVAQEGTLKKIKDTGTITIGHRESSVPFSYYDDKQQVVGYAMDLCNKIVDAVKADLKLSKLEVNLQPVTSATELNTEKNLGLNILPAKDHAEAFLMVETGRAAAFVMDDILLYSLVAGSKAPKDYEISADALSVEPYGIMLRKDDPAFKKVVDEAMIGVYKSGEINKIYDKWFLKPVPPKGVDLNVPMSDAFKKVVAKPTDSGNPKDYQ